MKSFMAYATFLVHPGRPNNAYALSDAGADAIARSEARRRDPTPRHTPAPTPGLKRKDRRQGRHRARRHTCRRRGRRRPPAYETARVRHGCRFRHPVRGRTARQQVASATCGRPHPPGGGAARIPLDALQVSRLCANSCHPSSKCNSNTTSGNRVHLVLGWRKSRRRPRSARTCCTVRQPPCRGLGGREGLVAGHMVVPAVHSQDSAMPASPSTPLEDRRQRPCRARRRDRRNAHTGTGADTDAGVNCKPDAGSHLHLKHECRARRSELSRVATSSTVSRGDAQRAPGKIAAPAKQKHPA